MAIRRFIQDHPTLSFFALVIGWSYPFMWVVLTLLPLDPVRGPTAVQILLVALGTSPSLIGVTLVGISAGRQGLREMLSRLAPRRIPLAWTIPAVMTVPVLNGLAYVANFAVGGERYPLPTAPLLFAVPAGIMTACLEEFGWRGFALPVLLRRFGALSSALILGLAWGIWHLPLFYLQRAHYGSLAIPVLLFESLLSLTALSVLMTWIYNNSRQSLLLMIAFHFSLTAGNFLLHPPAASSAEAYLRFHLVLAVIQWSLVGLVTAASGAKSLAHRRGRAAIT